MEGSIILILKNLNDQRLRMILEVAERGQYSGYIVKNWPIYGKSRNIYGKIFNVIA